MTLKSVAGQIGRQLGVPSVSLTIDEVSEHFEQASEHFGGTFLAAILAADAPVSSDFTRALLRWEPTHYTLLEDLQYGDYITQSLFAYGETVTRRAGGASRRRGRGHPQPT